MIYAFLYISAYLQKNGISVKVNMENGDPVNCEFTSEGETQVLTIEESTEEINRLLEKFHKKG